MHNFLKRQLRRYFGDSFSVPDEWREFVNAVNDAYREFDSDRKMLERSLDLSSQELLHANSQMRAIFQAIPDLLFRLDNEDKILHYEAGSTDDFFLQPKDLIGKRIQDVPLKDVGNEFNEAIRKVRETRAVTNFDYSLMIRKQKRFYEARVFPLFEDQIIIIIRNITKRKQSVEALRESQQQLADIINFLPDATFVIDKEGKVIAWNRAIQEMTGISAENMLGEGDYKYALPFYGERRPILIDLVLRPEQKIEVKYMRIERRDKILVGETYVPALRGSELFLLGTACTLHDSGGNVVGAIQSIRDITKGKRAEEAIIRAEEKYRSIFENAVMGIFQTSPEGRILSANPAFARILGYDSPEDVINNLTDISRQMYADPNRRSELLRLTEERDTLGEFELRALRKDGSSIWLTLNVRAVRDINGKLIYLDGSAQDITDRKLLESRLLHSQKMEAIGTLAGGIAHDFNNILSAILGYCEMTKMNLNQPKLQGFMEQVIKASDRAKNLVQQILTFSRKAEKEIKPVDMVLLTKEALTMLRATVPSTIRISEEIDKGVHTVIADPTQIHQILVNLCTNAAFAMREKGGVLKIGLCNVEIHQDITTFNSDLHPGIYLKLTVSDTGIGIAPEIIHRIFDPFFTTKKKGEGTGLGLSVVYGIVKECGGTLTVQSEPFVGSVFSVYFPAIADNTKSEAELDEPILTGKERILLVDDEQILAEMWQDMLKELGYEVTATTESIKALANFRSQPYQFDIVITDMTMPDMNGVTLSRELLKIRRDIPIILYTGFSELVTEGEAMDAGIKAFVMKPFSLKEIAKRIRSVLDQQ